MITIESIVFNNNEQYDDNYYSIVIVYNDYNSCSLSMRNFQL